MIEFYGRDKELKVIDSWYEASRKGTLFTAIIGRRRIGKTRLWIEASNKKRNSLYLFCLPGPFVQPGMTVHGNVQQVGRNIIMGDQIKAGRDIHQTLNSQFREVLKRVESLPKEEQPVVRSAVETVRDQVKEIQQSGIEDETSPKYGALKKGLKTLVEWVPDIADVVLGFLSSPATGIVSAVRKVAERIKSEMK
jgi:hypothetical protein